MGIMTAITYTLIVWLAAAAVPQRLTFGPFSSADECERIFAWAADHYVGDGKLSHECRPSKSRS
jgi:hypothetical protein